jgi:hypothetical protein
LLREQSAKRSASDTQTFNIAAKPIVRREIAQEKPLWPFAGKQLNVPEVIVVRAAAGCARASVVLHAYDVLRLWATTAD